MSVGSEVSLSRAQSAAAALGLRTKALASSFATARAVTAVLLEFVLVPVELPLVVGAEVRSEIFERQLVAQERSIR